VQLDRGSSSKQHVERPTRDDAVDVLERRLFFDRFSSRYEDLRADPAAWTSIESERELECGAVRHPPA
jgi:hypothetical protein